MKSIFHQKPLQVLMVLAMLVAFSIIPATRSIVMAQYQNQPNLVGSVVQSDYLLSAGDSISIEDTVMGEISENTRILTDGTINLPLVGRIQIGGHSLSQAAALLNNEYKKFYVNPDIAVKITFQHPTRIYVNGAVANPGVYVSGKNFRPENLELADPGTANTQNIYYRLYLTDALIMAGGLSFNANIRDVKVIRSQPDAKTIHVDLWDLFGNGNVVQDFPLRDNDVIEISELPKEMVVMDAQWDTITKTNISLGMFSVNVVGAVRTPGTYEVKAHDTVLKAIAKAGGFDELANKKEVYILRANSAGQVFKRKLNLSDKFLVAESTGEDFGRLLPNDVILVDESGAKKAGKFAQGLLNRATTAAMLPLFNQIIDFKE